MSTAINLPDAAARRAAAEVARPLFDRSLRGMLAMLGCALALLGLIVGFAALLRPAPQPHFVGLWLLPPPSQWTLRETVAANDLAALEEGDYFAHWRGLPAGPKTPQMISDELQRLERLSTTESVVVYLVATCEVDRRNRLQIAVNGAPTSETIALREFLTHLRDCPARGKLLVLDLAPPSAEAPWATTPADAAARIISDLDAVPDAQRIVLCSCGSREAPLASEIWQRTPLGYYFEQALRGRADGALDGRRDGCVTAREASRFVQTRVEHWASIALAQTYTPMLIGSGRDFPLVTISSRQRREATDISSGNADNVAAASPSSAGDAYPQWLAAAWDQRQQMWQRREYRWQARLFRRWELALLRAEQQWRGGRDPEAIRGDLERQLDHFRSDLRHAQASLPSAEPFSAAQLQQTVPAAEQSAAQKALEKLLRGLEAKTQSLPPEAAAAVRLTLVKSFLEQTKQLSGAALVNAIVRWLENCESPTPDRVVLLDQLLRTRQPQPRYVETLLLRRLADLARGSPDRYDAESVRRALRVAQLRGAISVTDRSFPWTADQRRAAAQLQHNGEYLLLHAGYAPAERAQAQLAQAEKAFEGVAGARDTLLQAYQTLDVALLRLPLHCAMNEALKHDDRVWFDAVEQTCWLADAFDPRRAATDAGRVEWARRRDELEARSLALANMLQELERPYSVEATRALIRRAARDEEPLRAYGQMDAVLCWPGLTAVQRKELLAAHRAIAADVYDQLSEDMVVRERPSITAGLALTSSAAQSPSADAKRRLRASQALLRLGGLHVEVQESLPCTEKLTAIGERIDEAIQGGAEDKSKWSQARMGAILPLCRAIPFLDNVETNPQLALERELRRRRFAWLAEDFAYRAHDDTPVLNAELERRYAALAGSPRDAYLRFTTGGDVARPVPAHPASESSIEWQIAGDAGTKTQATGGRVLQPDGALPLETTALQDGLELRWRWSTDAADNVDDAQRGVLVEVDALDRTWHQRLDFQPAPWSEALELLTSTDANQPGAPAGDLRLRPSAAPQSYFLSLRNPTDHGANITLEIPGVATAALSLPARATTPIRFHPQPPKPGATAVECDRRLPVLIRDTQTGKVLTQRTVPLKVLSPEQYVRVIESRFVPGEEGDNRLAVRLAADNLPPGPPCRAEMRIDAATVPGLIGVAGGTLRGELRSGGDPLTLTATGLQLIDGYSERAEFSLIVDGVPRAMTFAATLPRRGDPTSPRQVARPGIRLTAPPLARSGAGFHVPVHVLQAPADASIRVRIGEMTEGGFVSQLQQQMVGPRRRRIRVAPRKDGGLAFHVALEDWVFDFDTAGLVGPRIVKADIVAAGGRAIAVCQQRVTFDDSPPERTFFADAPDEVPINRPIVLQVAGRDSLSGIEKVFVFAGRPVDGKPPASVTPAPAEYLRDVQRWSATLPAEKLAGPLEVTAQVVNGVGLDRFATTRLRIVDSQSAHLSTVQGVVLEGSRPQPRLTVTLLDEQGGAVGGTSTDAAGKFAFRNVKPGKYSVRAAKPASGRQATKGVAVVDGKSANVSLELAL